MTTNAPSGVLSEQLAERIGDRVVETALFTTYNFDPGFFELNILPLLFPKQHFSEQEKVRRLQLEDNLRAIKELAVYFDANALAHDAETARLGYSRYDVRWPSGVFHPKLIVLLVREESEKDVQAAIVCCQSANLTRAGWWENLECAHIEEVPSTQYAKEVCTFRSDLTALLERVKQSLENDKHLALDRICSFFRNDIRTDGLREAQAKLGATRIFGGVRNSRFPNWLLENTHATTDANVEVISPYFDKHRLGALQQIFDVLKPRHLRVYLPRGDEGEALIDSELYHAVNDHRGIQWSDLDGKYIQRKGGASQENLSKRFVHAKLLRIWKRDEYDLLVVGSVNCTSAAHNPKSNLEAAFLVNGTQEGLKSKWLLENNEVTADTFETQNPAEEDGSDCIAIQLQVTYDWSTKNATLFTPDISDKLLILKDLFGNELARIESLPRNSDFHLDDSCSDRIKSAIENSSFLQVNYGDTSWRILIREHNFSHRPSLIAELTAQEILKYWALLTPAQRTLYLERRLIDSLEGIATTSSGSIAEVDSIFQTYAGIYHAFGHLQRHLTSCFEEERFREAETLLFGKKYDSLPELLDKVSESDECEFDPTEKYVTFLTAKQLRNWVYRVQPCFVQERTKMMQDMHETIERGLRTCSDTLKKANDISPRFLAWFESQFLQEVSPN